MPEVADRYVDVWGQPREIDPEVREALGKALGRGRAPRRKAVPRKGRCHQPEFLDLGGRLWGFTVQLYGLRSGRNWGIGDFGDLRALVELSAGMGAGFVGVSPLHATSGASPYSPSSRHALNVLYLDVEALPEFAACAPAQRLVKSARFRRALESLRESELVDYDGVRRAKLEVLDLLFREARPPAGGVTPGMRSYALYEALREKLGGGWQGWPAQYRKPGSRAVLQFASRNARRVNFHLWLQVRAREQLDAVQRRALELAMPVGLYVDLALGADAGGAEVWGGQETFALGVSTGAPPDEFNPRGQDWGLPPYSPRALRAAGYAPFIELLRANMPEGGALRLDHVMSLMRLWWIPRLGDGPSRPDRGGYVHYPFKDLLAILAEESRRARCLVVGEDLGTVLPELRSALTEAGVLSYRPLLFERTPDGRFAPPEAYPREALVCVTTHDLPTWKGFFANHDLGLRTQIGLSVDPAREGQLREQDQKGILQALGGEDPHGFLARTPAKLMAVQPEDVFELTEQANLPGTVDQHPNWRRRLPVPLERWDSEPRVAALARRVSRERGMHARVPRATYRLQLHKDFTFRDATALVPYLARLGISHVYASPFLKARPGSQHGYDIVDHNQLNPEIGSEADFQALLRELNRHGMGLVMDIVPNHMGVMHGDNAWWQDVLARGRASPYARYFDIDWLPGKRELWGKVLVAVLGRHYGEALEEGELVVDRQGIRYYGHRFPLSAKSLDALRKKGRLRDPLEVHRVLERQNYRLAYWRVAADEINYRRFFEIVDLAGLRMEDRVVFEATHRLIGRLARLPGVDGLRVDHPDGLADPRGYFERLRQLGRKPWIVVEKIVADFEDLPADWPVHGTTGYRFANLLTGLFVDKACEARMTRIYQRFSGDRRHFEEIASQSRMLIMHTTLAADLNRLATRLARIASGNRFTRDYTVIGLRQALSEVAAHFPVYRTYVTEQGASETDRRYIEWAVGKARRASRIADPSLFDFIRDVLLLRIEAGRSERRSDILDFAMRFQQFTAPVVAKGVEDTAFYRFHRLSALNEVGGDPCNFGFSLKAFHAASEGRAKRWPHTMLATSTHDTKRSEDVRARLVVLSELASGWRLTLRRWALLNRSSRRDIDGEPAPHPKDEYLFYQTLAGIWPHPAPRPEDMALLGERLASYMLKAVREAKERTSWINPDAEYEQALEGFVEQSLANPLFVKDVNEVVPRLAHLGLLVGLSQAVLKVASPGVPDYYQGTELWDFSLVDPDNRRPVDYGLRRKALENPGTPEDLLANLADGQAKQFVIAKGLELRKALPDLYEQPTYTALYADGGHEEHVCAFMLGSPERGIVAIAPRLFARLVPGEGTAPLGDVWGDARLALPAGRYRNVLTGDEHQAGADGVRVSSLLARFPAALLVTATFP